MHHAITPEYAPQRLRRQRGDDRHLPGIAGQKPGTLGLAPVRSFQDQPSPATPQPFPRLLEAGNGLAGAAGQAKQIADPPDQRRLEQDGKILGHCDRAAGGPGERSGQATFVAGGF